MLIEGEEKKIVHILGNDIEKAKPGTLFFNNSFPEYNDEYVGKVLSAREYYTDYLVAYI